MKLLADINLLDNLKLLNRLGLWGIILTIGMTLVFAMIGISLDDSSGGIFGSLPKSGLQLLMGFLIFCGLFMILMVCHELIHGFFFKIFAPDSQVQFGFKQGMAYATSPGTIYPKGQISVIILAPFIIISLGLTIAFIMGGLSLLMYTILAGFHGGSCVGDFYYIYLFLIHSTVTHVEDTEKGIKLYQEKEY